MIYNSMFFCMCNIAFWGFYNECPAGFGALPIFGAKFGPSWALSGHTLAQIHYKTSDV